MNSAFVKILPGCGLGNQIQFIPAVKELKGRYENISSDSLLYEALMLLKYNSDEHIGSGTDIYVPMWPDWKNFWKWRIKHPLNKVYGFKYRILKQSIGFGYTKSIKIDLDIPEIVNNNQLVPNAWHYILPGLNSVKGNIVIANPQGKKYDRQYKFMGTMAYHLKSKGYNVTVVGEDGRWFNDIKELIEFMKKQEYFIGGDCGLMHLADILGMPGIVFWGNTRDKNKPVNNIKVVDGLLTPAEKAYEIFISLQNKKNAEERRKGLHLPNNEM